MDCSAEAEIAELRALEAEMQRGQLDMDRLQRDLIAAHPGNLVIFGWMPAGTWAELPPMWQSSAELRLTPRFGIPHIGVKRVIAVSPDLAKTIIKRNRRAAA